MTDEEDSSKGKKGGDKYTPRDYDFEPRDNISLSTIKNFIGDFRGHESNVDLVKKINEKIEEYEAAKTRIGNTKRPEWGIKGDRLYDNEDHVHVNIGYEGKGKSTLGLIICKTIDPDFQPLKQTVYSSKEFRYLVDSLPEREMKAVMIDEGSEMLFNRDAMSKPSKKAIQKLKTCREKNLFIWINFPSEGDLDKQLWKRIRSFSKCSTTRKGLSYWWWGRRAIRAIDEKGLDDITHDTIWMFDKIQEDSQFWKDYLRKKSEGTSEETDQEDEFDLEELVEDVRVDIDRYMKEYTDPKSGTRKKTIVTEMIEYDFGVDTKKAKKVKNIVKQLEGWG